MEKVMQITEKIYQSAILPEHIEHLNNEGFTFSQITQWVEPGLESLTQEQAAELGFKAKDKDDKWVSGSGLYFPLKGSLGSLDLTFPLSAKRVRSPST
jgi:hypothetical protein